MNDLANILMIQPGSATDAVPANETVVLDMASRLRKNAWVYVGEKGRHETEDLADGVRLMGWGNEVLDHFGNLDLVIVINDAEQAQAICENRPDLPVISWTLSDGSSRHFDQLELKRSFTPWFSVIESMLFRDVTETGKPSIEEFFQSKDSLRLAS